MAVRRAWIPRLVSSSFGWPLARLLYLSRRTTFYIRGSNNEISIGRKSLLTCCRVRIFGSNNRIFIGECCTLEATHIDIFAERSTISIGDKVFINGNHMGKSHLLARGIGVAIDIGEDSMIGYGCEIRTSDSHSIINANGQLLNPDQNVHIGSHVWICARAMVLKGSTIGNGAVIGAGSIVAGKIPSNSLSAGIPAKVIRLEIKWLHDKPALYNAAPGCVS